MARRLQPALAWLRLAGRWLILCLAGWSLLVSAAALQVIVALGAPLYDWHWYLAAGLLPLVAGARAALGWPSRRASAIAAALLLAWLAMGYAPPGAGEELEPAARPPVALSFWAYGDFRDRPDDLLADLAAAGGSVYLHAPTTSFAGEEGAALAAGLRRLAAHGVPVVLMPPASDFLSVPTADEWSERAERAAAFVARERLDNVWGLIGDAEPPLRGLRFNPAAGRAEFDAAARRLADLLATLNREHRGLQVGVTALWPHYLDGADGDADLAIAMRSPVDPPGGWDFLNVMAYSSYRPREQRAYYVYAVGQGFARRYPQARTSYLIGLVGGGYPWEPVMEFDDLARDAQLLRALGAREVVVFQLSGALSQFGPDFVRRLSAAVNGPAAPATLRVPYDRGAGASLYALALADAALDARGSRGWLWAGWAIASALLVYARRGRSGNFSAPPAS